MLKIQKVYNATFGDEQALINSETNEVIIKGDYYHNKISEFINGIIYGLKYMNFDFELLDGVNATPDMEIFDICGFYNDSDCDYCDEDDVE